MHVCGRDASRVPVREIGPTKGLSYVIIAVLASQNLNAARVRAGSVLELCRGCLVIA